MDGSDAARLRFADFGPVSETRDGGYCGSGETDVESGVGGKVKFAASGESCSGVENHGGGPGADRDVGDGGVERLMHPLAVEKGFGLCAGITHGIECTFDGALESGFDIRADPLLLLSGSGDWVGTDGLISLHIGSWKILIAMTVVDGLVLDAKSRE